MIVAENQNDTVQHAINAAQANAENSEDKQQVDQLASQLKSSVDQTNQDTKATSE
jgi:hypothetical protein